MKSLREIRAEQNATDLKSDAKKTARKIANELEHAIETALFNDTDQKISAIEYSNWKNGMLFTLDKDNQVSTILKTVDSASVSADTLNSVLGLLVTDLNSAQYNYAVCNNTLIIILNPESATCKNFGHFVYDAVSD